MKRAGESLGRRAERVMWEIAFRSLMNNYCRLWWRPRLLNPEAFPDEGPCFIYGNHTNRYDPFLLNCFTAWGDPTAGVMTRERMRSKALARAFDLFSVLPVRKRIAEPGLVRAMKQMLEEGKRIVIYPEGGSRWTGRPEPWIPSTAKVFMRMGVPVYPVWTHGSFVTWPRWAKWPRPGRVELEVGSPMEFERRADPAEGLHRLKTAIDRDGSETPEHLKPRWAYRPADGLERLLYRDPESGQQDALYTPDGTTFRNRTGSREWKVMPDSMLQDSTTGEIINPSLIYDEIRGMGLSAESDGVLLQNRVNLAEEFEFPKLQHRGAGTALLRRDALEIRSRDHSEVIALEKVLAFDIERNYKFQVSTAEKMWELSFIHGGSALAWKDAFQRLGVAPI